MVLTSRGRGVGHALLEEARRFATEMGAAGSNLLETVPENYAARRLYDTTGWEKDASLHYILSV